jgi:hypothetical protein
MLSGFMSLCTICNECITLSDSFNCELKSSTTLKCKQTSVENSIQFLETTKSNPEINKTLGPIYNYEHNFNKKYY